MGRANDKSQALTHKQLVLLFLLSFITYANGFKLTEGVCFEYLLFILAPLICGVFYEYLFYGVVLGVLSKLKITLLKKRELNAILQL